MDNSAPNPKRIRLRHNSITEYFKCNKCENYLTPPTSFCLEGHILCQPCANNENECPRCGKELSTKLNEFIGRVAKDLKFPCKYAKNGCFQFCKWNEGFEHFNKCNYRTLKCPFSTVTQIDWGVKQIAVCQWEGTVFDLKNHILDKVHDGLIKNDGESCTVVFDINLSKKHVYPILMGDQVYLIQLTRTPEKTTISLKYVGNFENADNYEAEFKINNRDNNFELTYKLDCKHLSNNGIECAEEIPNSVLESFINEDLVLNCSLKIITRKPIPKSCDSLLFQAECPICCEYMFSNIYICSAGHSICETCKARVTFCPTCRARVESIRNYNLESLISKLQFPCIFNTNGCENLVTPDKMEEHVAGCSFGKYKCPISPCVWEGSQDQMLVHAADSHQYYFKQTNYYNYYNTWYIHFQNFSNMRRIIQIVSAYQKPFICYYERNVEENLFYVAVQTYENKASDYYYTFQINSEGNRYITAQEVCTYYKEPISEVISKKQCIVMNLENVETFLNEDVLTGSNIIKKNTFQRQIMPTI